MRRRRKRSKGVQNLGKSVFKAEYFKFPKRVKDNWPTKKTKVAIVYIKFQFFFKVLRCLRVFGTTK